MTTTDGVDVTSRKKPRLRHPVTGFQWKQKDLWNRFR